MITTQAQLARDISIYKMSWLSKRHSVYARGGRAAWTECQWWVEMKKEDDTRRAGARGGKLGGRQKRPRVDELPRGRERPRGVKDYI
jgi:hypothetical protein